MDDLWAAGMAAHWVVLRADLTVFLWVDDLVVMSAAS